MCIRISWYYLGGTSQIAVEYQLAEKLLAIFESKLLHAHILNLLRRFKV